MVPLHNCETCGFLSTHGPAFTHRSHLLVCQECASDIDRGAQPVTRWFAEKIAARKGVA